MLTAQEVQQQHAMDHGPGPQGGVCQSAANESAPASSHYAQNGHAFVFVSHVGLEKAVVHCITQHR